MTKPWNTKEWKERRESFIKDKKCAQCGSSDSLVVHHHNEPVVQGLSKWKSFKNSILRSKKYVNLNNEEIKKLTDEKFAEWKIKTDENYNNFTEENVIILCKKCHFAIHHGMDLCPKCKTNYKQFRFKTCYKCVYPPIEVILPCGEKTMIDPRQFKAEGTEDLCWDCKKYDEPGMCEDYMKDTGEQQYGPE